VTKADSCRFCRIYAIGVIAFAAFVGAVMAAQAGFGLQKFGGAEHIMRVVMLSGVRSLAPGVTGSALLVAFVVWAHPLPVPRLEVELPRLLKRAMLVSLPGYVAAVMVVPAVALLVSHLAFAVPWAAWGVALRMITTGDWAAGAFSAVADAALIVFLAWRYLARLQAGRSSLPMKLVLVWTFATGLRLTLGLLSTLFLPA
jgi:Permease MlaE